MSSQSHTDHEHEPLPVVRMAEPDERVVPSIIRLVDRFKPMQDDLVAEIQKRRDHHHNDEIAVLWLPPPHIVLVGWTSLWSVGDFKTRVPDELPSVLSDLQTMLQPVPPAEGLQQLLEYSLFPLRRPIKRPKFSDIRCTYTDVVTPGGFLLSDEVVAVRTALGLRSREASVDGEAPRHESVLVRSKGISEMDMQQVIHIPRSKMESAAPRLGQRAIALIPARHV